MIQIAITDDHPMIIGGLQNMLEGHPHIFLRNHYRNGSELLEGLKDHLPDVLILDIQLPDQTGDELAPIILKKYPDLRILALTNFDSPLYAYNMIRHGVKGYILKTTDPTIVITAIETIYNGAEFIDPSIKDRLQEFMLNMKKEAFIKPKLTPRESEILQLIVKGYSSQEIADTLFIGLRTVDYYRLNILLKMDVKNTILLVKKALQLGLAK
jgi:DNA-binding NarL/FixJ family response regulator